MSKDYGVSEREIEIVEFDPFMKDLDNLIHNYKKWFNQNLDSAVTDGPIGDGNEGSKIYNLPIGTVLIFGTKASEFSSLMKPLIHSVAAGNYTILAPEQSTTTTLKFLIHIIEKSMNPERVFVMHSPLKTEDLEKALQNHKVAMIFDSRSEEITSQIAPIASRQRIRFCANSQGLNIAIVDEHANIPQAAKMIAEQKFYKAGQSTNNIDMLYVDEAAYPRFIEEFKNAIYYEHSNLGPTKYQYGSVIGEDIFNGIQKMIQDPSHKGTLETSYLIDQEKLIMGPMIIKNPVKESKLLHQKHNSPVLPVVTFSNLHDTLADISQKDNVNTLYFFSNSPKLCEDLQSVVPCKQLYYNCTGLYSQSNLVPDFGRMNSQEGTVRGIFGFHTFTRPKLFTVGNQVHFTLLPNKLKNLPSRALNKISKRRVFPYVALAGFAIAYLI